MDARQQLKHARAQRLAGRAQDSFRVLAPLAAAQPGASAVRWELALTLLALRQYQRAAAEMDRVIDARPDFVLGLVTRARLRAHQLNDPRGASADVARALGQEPNHVEALVLEAELAEEAGEPERALPALSRLIDQLPDEVAYRVRRARLLAGASESSKPDALAQAIADLDVAIAATPEPDWLNQRGVLHGRLQNWEAATADFQAVLSRAQPGQPHHLAAMEGLRRCQRREPFDMQLAEVLSDWLQEDEPDAASPPADDARPATPTAMFKERWGALKTGMRDQVNRRLADQIGREIALLVRTPQPEYEVPDGRIRGVDWRFHRRVQKSLERLGFEQLADFEPLHLSRSTGVRSLERFYIDDAAVITARVGSAGHRPDGSLARLALKTVGQQRTTPLIELVSELENGDFVVTDNGAEDPFDSCSAVHPERLPADTSVEELVTRHRRRVAEHANAQATLPVRLDGLEDLHQQQQRLWSVRQRWRQGFGWFRDRELAALLAERHAELGDLVRRSLVEHLEHRPDE